MFIVISTSGDGVPPTDARAWYDSLARTTLKLFNLKFSVLALGDSNYPHFCRTGRIVDQRLEYLGASPIVQRSDVDMEDWSVISDWIEKVIAALATVAIETRIDYLSPRLPRNNDQHDRNRPFMAKMIVKRNLTKMTSADDKQTIHCEFNLEGSGLSFTAGDALGIYPQNNPTEVQYLLEVLHCTGEEVVDVPSWAYLPKAVGLTLLVALMKYYDLKHVKPELVQALQEGASDTIKKKIGMDLLRDGLSKKNAKLHKYLEEREVADVLLEMGGDSTLKIHKVLENLRGLQPRYYSISSSPVVDSNIACVTAAVVRYKTLGRQRTGVTTTFLEDRLSIEQTCPVFISQNPDFRLPSNKQLPIIMIGPGTGIAPFRAFIQERVHSNATGANLLYFGCRHEHKDFLYANELEAWAAQGHLILRTAFSRDQNYKVYVQDVLREDAQIIWSYLQAGACLYVCGDAKHMAHDVHRALIDICQLHMDQSEAVKYLTFLEENQRYQKDVWVT
ncbi:NADPH oxidoreductase A-like [Ptychodera flava]|uniref:NADPH oxidoreductase A-like n=1 Tax=Ptychodera flava TaxID=63121 RepID=UPI00396A7D20